MAVIPSQNLSSWWPYLKAFALAIVVYPLSVIIYNTYWHPLSKIPGPSTWAATRLPFIRALIRGTIVHDLQKLHNQYGPVLRIGPNEVTFAHPDAWRDIFQSRGTSHEQFLKDPTWWKSQPNMPNSLISAIDIQSHARIRSSLAPGFTPRALRAQEPIIQRYVNLLVERLQSEIEINSASSLSVDEKRLYKDIDLVTWLNFTTFDIFGDLGFGESFNCLEDAKYHPWIALLFNSVKAASFVISARYYPIIEYLLMKLIPPSLRKMQRDHYQQIVDKVQRRLNFELERPDIMSHVISGNNDDNEQRAKMSIGELNTTFMVLTTAGSETTATTLVGTLNQLVHNPDKLYWLQDEIRSTFQDITEVSLETVRRLPYLNAVINEGLRLCPPIPWMLPRVVPRSGDTVCNTWLPGGTSVSIQTYTMNRDPSYFHCANEFLPERWLDDAQNNSTSKFFDDQRHALQPFSVGPRNCMGQNLAWAEMRLILVKLLYTFDIAAIEGERVDWEDLRTFLLVEKKPIKFRLQLRQ